MKSQKRQPHKRASTSPPSAHGSGLAGQRGGGDGAARPSRDDLPHLGEGPGVLGLAAVAGRDEVVEPLLLGARQRQADELPAARADRLGVLQHRRHQPLKQQLPRALRVPARKVERLRHARARQRPEQQLERLRRPQHRLRRVVVRQRQAVVVRLGVPHQDRDDVVGEFRGEGRVREVLEGKLWGEVVSRFFFFSFFSLFLFRLSREINK